MLIYKHTNKIGTKYNFKVMSVCLLSTCTKNKIYLNYNACVTSMVPYILM